LAELLALLEDDNCNQYCEFVLAEKSLVEEAFKEGTNMLSLIDFVQKCNFIRSSIMSVL